jgi:Fungal specific transcription factor domain
LPIANSQKTSSSTSDAKPQASLSSTKYSASPPKSREPDIKGKGGENGYGGGFSRSPEGMNGNFTSAGYQASAPMPIPIPTSAPGSHPGWHVPGFNEHLEGYSALSGKHSRLHLRPRPLQRLHTQGISSYDEGGVYSTPSAGSVSSYSESDFPSPSEFPQTPEEIPFAEPSINSFPDPYASYPQDAMAGVEACPVIDVPRSYPNPATDDYLASSLGSDHMSNYGPVDVYSPAEPIPPTSISDFFYFQDVNQMATDMSPQFRATSNQDAEYFSDTLSPAQSKYSSSVAWGSAIPRSIDPSSFHHLSPRIQFLVDYYDKAICPVLVAFDGPTNPYRMHIMHLAGNSKSVQNAIAALATNNIRMRGLKELHRFGVDPSDHLSADDIRDMHSDPTPEELRYKATSVALFNASLNNRVSAADDANLATLLILCLYHVCDSGFTKFRTQLAGVQKLLQMRDRRGGTTTFDGWIQMFFTWFDVMTATVNDRETQVRGEALDMLDLSANLGAMEHLAGCEGRLFKLIARLGRLNLLSQNRPVRGASYPPSQVATPRPSPGPQQQQQCFSPQSVGASKAAQPKDFYSLDGNGWGSPIPMSPGGGIPMSPPSGRLAPVDMGTPTSNSSGTTAGNNATPPDPRNEFWTEWYHIRSRLTSWALDTSHPSSHLMNSGALASPASIVASDADTASLHHISESFRHAALLYTERLGSPHLPPSAPSIQTLVSTALRHIAAIPVNSCVNKFLLWPVFIVGTECVHAADRDIIRMRCVEIMRESGFFNNLSGLEVLERVWAEDDAGEGLMFVKGVDGCETPMLSALGGQAFRWRRAMVRVDGEYIVV